MSKAKLTLGVVALALLTACASPTVVQKRQANDEDLSCKQLSEAYAEAHDFEAKARKERGVTGTNVVAALFFWPAMIGTYKNTEEAIEAAKDRQKHLEKIADSKQCKL